MVRSLKKKKQGEIKVSVSRRILKTRNTDYWKTVRNIRRRNFNSSLIVDGVLGNVNITMHFQDKFYTLFNSVQSLDVNLSLIIDTIVCREKCLCRDVVDSNLHCHIITKADVKKTIQKLKSNKIDEGGILFSNNFIHGTDLLLFVFIYVI